MRIQKLLDFLNKYNNLPAQGTDAWHSNRANSIGGSELSELIRNPKNVIATKAGLRVMPNVLPMMFGSNFEPVIRLITEHIFQTKIYECPGSIPSAEVNGKTYSPDGLAVAVFKCESDGRKFVTDLITLFEYKCLYSRPVKQMQVHAPYVPQVLSGLCDIPIAEIALYTEAQFALCSLKSIYTDECWMPNSRNTELREPLCRGFIGIYSEEEEPYVDYGEQPQLLYKVMSNLKSNVYKASYSAIMYDGDFNRCEFIKNQNKHIIGSYVDFETEVERFRAYCNACGYYPVGILPYKLVDINIVPVEKKCNYTKQYEPAITDALKKVQMLLSVEDEDDRYELFQKLMGENNTSVIDTLTS